MSAPAVTTPGANVHEFTSDLIVRHRSTPAEGVAVLDLGHPENEDLPRWEPGAHIDLLLDDGLTRQYSLLNPCGDFDRYEIAIAKSAVSRGGSSYVHTALNVGHTLDISEPRNNFSLQPDHETFHFVAGGIGSTTKIYYNTVTMTSVFANTGA